MKPDFHHEPTVGRMSVISLEIENKAISPPFSFAPLSTMVHFKGKKSSFFLNIIFEKKLAAALGEKLKNMFKIKK